MILGMGAAAAVLVFVGVGVAALARRAGADRVSGMARYGWLVLAVVTAGRGVTFLQTAGVLKCTALDEGLGSELSFQSLAVQGLLFVGG